MGRRGGLQKDWDESCLDSSCSTEETVSYELGLISNSFLRKELGALNDEHLSLALMRQ